MEGCKKLSWNTKDIRIQAAYRFLSDIIYAVHLYDICKWKATKAFENIKPPDSLLFTESKQRVS